MLTHDRIELCCTGDSDESSVILVNFMSECLRNESNTGYILWQICT